MKPGGGVHQKSALKVLACMPAVNHPTKKESSSLSIQPKALETRGTSKTFVWNRNKPFVEQAHEITRTIHIIRAEYEGLN